MEKFKHFILTLFGIFLILVPELMFKDLLSEGGMNIVYAAVIIAVLALVYVSLPMLTSRYWQSRYSGFNGLWGIKYFKERELIKRIKSSKTIKIKVTHGGVFRQENNDVFYRCIVKNEFKLPTVTNIQILLNYPCQNSEHLEGRAEKIYKMAENKYLGEIYEVLKILLEAKKEHQFNNISIRLYGDQQIKWRYYIFESHKKKKFLYLGLYENTRKGTDIPLLKVQGNLDNKTICDEFEDEFDNVFENKAFDIDEIFSNADFDTKKVKLECVKSNQVCAECHNAFVLKIKQYQELYDLAIKRQ